MHTEQTARIMVLEQCIEKQAAAILQGGEVIAALGIAAIKQNKRITELEVGLRQNVANLTAIIADGAEINADVICVLRRRVDEQAKRIEKLETAAAQDERFIDNLQTASGKQYSHIGRLEAALMDVARCLIDGKVDMAAIMPGELHGHRILGAESVQTVVEVYHRLKAQANDTP